MRSYRPLTDRQVDQLKTRSLILSTIPIYPDTEKGAATRAKIAVRTGRTFTDAVWNYWLVRLLKEKTVIRRPGAQICRPRCADDLTHHVAPGTPKPKKPKRVLFSKVFHVPLEPALKAANEALELQMKNYSQK